MMATIPKEIPSSFSDQSIEFFVKFSRIGLEYAGAEGCSIRVASPDGTLIPHISARVKAFLNIIR